MKFKLICLVFIAYFSTLIYAQGTICTFEFIGNDYTCRLINQTINRNEDIIVIGGDHLESFGDINVQRVEQVNSTVEIFPNLMIDRFVNLRTLYLDSTQMRFWEQPIQRCARLQELKIDGNSFIGLLSEIFRECNRLSYLSINDNNLREIPNDAFVGLSSLDTLSLSHNIIRTLTNEMLTHIGNLSKLILSNNQIVEMTEEILRAVPNLQWLDLNHNSITTWNVDILRSNPRIQRLFLSGNEIVTLAENTFSNLPNLVELWIGSYLEKVPTFHNVSNVEIFGLSGNLLANISSEPFWHMTNLRTLHLDRNRIENFDFFVGYPRFLEHLETLDLSHNLIGWLEDCSLETLTTVKHLSLSFNQLRRIPYDYIRFVLPLSSLDITRNRINRIDRRVFEESEAIYLYAKDNECFNDDIFVNSTAELDNLQDCFSSAGILNTNIFALISIVVASIYGMF